MSELKVFFGDLCQSECCKATGIAVVGFAAGIGAKMVYDKYGKKAVNTVCVKAKGLLHKDETTEENSCEEQ